jgi:SpoVK/Ycf46/Vps4 family AAA+-type ATPase
MEDLDAYIRNYGEESVLSFLDGENSCNNILTIASTNYPEKLDRRIVARPRRFDRVIKIYPPTDDMRRMYFYKKLNIENEELEKYVTATKDFSFASLSELVISVKCFDKDFDETIQTLKDLSSKKSSSEEYYNAKAGFEKEK